MKGYYKNLHANKIQEINMSLYETITNKEMKAVLSVKKNEQMLLYFENEQA